MYNLDSNIVKIQRIKEMDQNPKALIGYDLCTTKPPPSVVSILFMIRKQNGNDIVVVLVFYPNLLFLFLSYISSIAIIQ